LNEVVIDVKPQAQEVVLIYHLEERKIAKVNVVLRSLEDA